MLTHILCSEQQTKISQFFTCKLSFYNIRVNLCIDVSIKRPCVQASAPVSHFIEIGHAAIFTTILSWPLILKGIFLSVDCVKDKQ